MRSGISKSGKSAREIGKHYDSVQERSRLFTHAGQLEFYRTKQIISGSLPRRRLIVLDIGGGPGAYACWLAKLGHTVHLVDPVPKHVQEARNASLSRRRGRLASATVGDARKLQFANESSHVVLLLGPLYHLVRKRDRLKALSEALRTLKPGGLLFVAAISRFASAHDGLFRGFFKDPEFFKIVRRDLRAGQHRNPTDRPEYFTTAFFHHPAELEAEIQEAGFALPRLYSVEGPAWMLPDFDGVWKNPTLRARLLDIVKAIENERSLIGQTAHILAVTRRTP